MKIIPVLGWATRVSKKNPQTIDYIALMGKKSIVNWESKAAKTRRIIGTLRQFNVPNPDVLLGCYGIDPVRLNSIKSYKELPSLAVSTADNYSRPYSIADKIKDFMINNF